jgi:superfamily I DNA/RNA helicase
MAEFWGGKEPFDIQFWKSAPFKDFARAFEAHGGWFGLFNWLSLQSEQELVLARSEQVQLITLHASKGLEFPLVFLPALEDGILPWTGPEEEDRDNFPSAERQLLMAEEKRLLYVGLTRAKEGLFLSRAEKRHLYGKELHLRPSRFLSRLPVHKVQHSATVIRHKTTLEHLSLF